MDDFVKSAFAGYLRDWRSAIERGDKDAADGFRRNATRIALTSGGYYRDLMTQYYTLIQLTYGVIR